MNTEQLGGKWNELKGEIRSFWGKISDDELEKTKGDVKAIQGLIQQRYGEKQQGLKEKLTQLFDKYSTKKDHLVSKAKDNLRH